MSKTISDMTIVINPTFPVKWYMKVLGYKGLTSFWGTIYFMTEDDFKNVRLVKHEMKHVEQMEKEGIFKFLVKYNYYWFKYGYKNNPYEIEAREAENGY